MKVYMSVDMEGVAGVAHFDEVTKGKQGYAEFQVQMTAEVKAACEGAVAAGAKEIWVKDAHDSGRNLIISDLPKPVKIIREWSGHPLGMMQEIDETFDAAIMIGYHSRSATLSLNLLPMPMQAQCLACRLYLSQETRAFVRRLRTLITISLRAAQ